MKILCFAFVVFCALLSSCESEDNIVYDRINSDNCIIAHMGIWADLGLPGNSRAAFKEALREKVYAVEFDVRQTYDGVLVINHDAVFDGKQIDKTVYSDLSGRLSNNETLPTLREFLTIYKECKSNVILFIELKACNVDDVINMLAETDVCNVRYTSFNLNYLDRIVALCQGTKAIYVGGKLKPNEIKKRGYGGFAYKYDILNYHQDWIKEGRNLGLEVCVWTIDDYYKIIKFADQGIKVYTNRAKVYSNLII